MTLPRSLGPLLGVLLLTSSTLIALAAAPAIGATGAQPAASGSASFINISATTQFSFEPNQVTVAPGSTVHLEVTQLATTLHTWVLSSVANYTIPTSYSTAQLTAFFVAHPPLVNLSLGSTAGVVTYSNFTAPAPGTYEFVCIVPGHFQSGMHGVLTVGSSSSSSSSGLSTAEIAAIAIVVIVIIAIVAAVLLRGRRKSPPATSAPSATAVPPQSPPTGPMPPTPPPSSP